MPYTTITAGNPIEAAWANANVRDQVVTPFASAAARAAAISSPIEGMVTYLTDTDSLEVYASAGTGWKPPWNLPWGRVTHVFKTTMQTNIGTAVTDVSGLNVSFTAIANRMYRAEAHLWGQAGTNPAFPGYAMVDNADEWVQSWYRTQANSGGQWIDFTVISYIFTGSGAKTLKIVVDYDANTNNQAGGSTATPAYLAVHDIGPTGAPA